MKPVAHIPLLFQSFHFVKLQLETWLLVDSSAGL